MSERIHQEFKDAIVKACEAATASSEQNISISKGFVDVLCQVLSCESWLLNKGFNFQLAVDRAFILALDLKSYFRILSLEAYIW